MMIRTLLLVAMIPLAACGDNDRGAHGEATSEATGALPDMGAITATPTGPLAGIAVARTRSTIRNPYGCDDGR